MIESIFTIVGYEIYGNGDMNRQLKPDNHIVVCVCTYKRTTMLSNLLNKLQDQVTENQFAYSVVVVDNDANQSARDIVTDWKQKSAIQIDYFCEPEQNIALARNKAVENAKGNLIAFIDDDEFPENQWLLNLYKYITHYQSDGILGPVLPYFEKEPPRWVLKGRFFDRPAHSSGYVLPWTDTRTGNVLLKKALFKIGQKWFDPSFGSGGEDRNFFRRMIEAGYVFVWSNEAPVFETVPPNRWNKRTLIKRALLRGKVAFNSANSKPLSVLYSIVAIITYSCYLPLFFFFGQHIFMKYLIKNCDHLGKVAAFLGIDLVTEKYVGV